MKSGRCSPCRRCARYAPRARRATAVTSRALVAGRQARRATLVAVAGAAVSRAAVAVTITGTPGGGHGDAARLGPDGYTSAGAATVCGCGGKVKDIYRRFAARGRRPAGYGRPVSLPSPLYAGLPRPRCGRRCRLGAPGQGRAWDWVFDQRSIASDNLSIGRPTPRTVGESRRRCAGAGVRPRCGGRNLGVARHVVVDHMADIGNCRAQRAATWRRTRNMIGRRGTRRACACGANWSRSPWIGLEIARVLHRLANEHPHPPMRLQRKIAVGTSVAVGGDRGAPAISRFRRPSSRVAAGRRNFSRRCSGWFQNRSPGVRHRSLPGSKEGVGDPLSIYGAPWWPR